MKASLWIDNPPYPSLGHAISASAVSAASGSASMLLGRVVGTPETETGLPLGWLRVEVPLDNPQSEVTGRSDGGLVAVGAVVAVLLDGSGKVMQISSPMSLPEGSEPEALGEAGRRLLAAQAEAAESLAHAEEAAKAAAEATSRAESVAADLVVERDRVTAAVGRVGSLEDAVDGVESRVEAAEAGVVSASAAAQAAQSDADEAKSAADAAKAAADAADSKAGAADATAQEAKAAAQAAQDDAGQAQTLAQSASTAASQAKSDAQAAKTQAATAQSAADTAQATATAARGEAQAAQADADAAGAAAATAQARADAAIAAAPDLAAPWTSNWYSGENITRAADKLTVSTETAGRADTIAVRFGCNTLAPFAQRAGRVYRYEAVVSATAAATVSQGMYYMSAGGEWKESIWPSTTRKDVPAGADRVLLVQDFRPTFTDDKPRAQFVSYVHCGTGTVTIHSARVLDVTDVVAAQAAADSAAAKAVTAQAAADSATAKALGAQSTADAANSKATTLSGLVTVATRNPATSDGSGKPTNAIWEVRSGSTLLRRFIWDGTTWTQVKAGQEFIGDNAIGRAQIADAAIGTAEIADAAVTNAKIGDLAVNKLTVAGGATIPQAVMNAVVSDKVFTDTLLAERVAVGATNHFPDPQVKAVGWDTTYVSNNGNYVGGKAIHIDGNGTQRGTYFQPAGLTDKCMILEPGTKYRFSFKGYFYNGQGTNGDPLASLYVRYRRTNGTVQVIRICSMTNTSAPTQTYAGEWTVPNDATGECTLGFYAEASLKGGGARGGDFSVEKMVGAVLIEDGAITADKITASKEMWAKVGQFAEVTTDMLTAGNATIAGTAVVGDLIGNRLIGGEIKMQSLDMEQEGGLNLIDPALWNKNTTYDNTKVALYNGGLRMTRGDSREFISFNVKAMNNIPNRGTGYKVRVRADWSVPKAASSSWIYVSYFEAGVDPDQASSVSKLRMMSTPINSDASRSEVLSVPDGASIFAVSIRVNVKDGYTNPADLYIQINSMSIEWVPLTYGVVHLRRDTAGAASILIGDSHSEAVLRPLGAEYSENGAFVGDRSWRSLVAPPAGYLKRTGNWTHGRSGNWVMTNLVTGGTSWTRNGVTASGSSLIVPVAGLYRVYGRAHIGAASGRCGLTIVNGTTYSSELNKGIDSFGAYSHPYSVKPFVFGYMNLAAGAQITLWIFQETGTSVNSGDAELLVEMV